MTILYDFEDCRATWSYKSLLGPGQVLCGEYVRIFGKSPSNPISKPLGTIYDEEKEQWIVADSGNNALRLFGMSSDAGDVVTAPQLKNPSALAIWNPGKEVAVLDETNIRIFDQRSGRFITIADVNNCRGLGVTDGGEFVTIQYNRNGSEIVFYSPEMPNQVLSRSPYVVNKAASNLAPKPCFLDISHNKVCVTDLGVNGFSIYDLELETLHMELRRQEVLPGATDGSFQFISGVKFDKNDELLIADASGYKLQYFDREGRFLHRVRFPDGFLYASSLALNSKHQLLACDRIKGTLKLYQLKGANPETIIEQPAMKPFRNQKSDLDNLNRNGGRLTDFRSTDKIDSRKNTAHFDGYGYANNNHDWSNQDSGW